MFSSPAKLFLCWFATVSTLLLCITWMATIWCTIRWQCPGGRWCEISDGRLLSGGLSGHGPESTEFNVSARTGPVDMHWMFDWDDRTPRGWAVPLWAPLILTGTLTLWTWGRNTYNNR